MTLIRDISAGALLLCALFLSGCASGNGLWVEVGDARYAVEIADDDAERARGLMFRDHMADDRGMLFIHERQAPQAYWMKNTRIALDILYFDDDRRLVSQQRDVVLLGRHPGRAAVGRDRRRTKIVGNTASLVLEVRQVAVTQHDGL